ncbi:hypothetical protein [Dyella sp. C11]|uniref:hypothetical protein n=1 Tax=Dyella sp. C11 TaxID=2126991 RepID=UPI0013004F7B|nr:hypothetical protein [Dyella sp. C11]
MNTWPAWGRWCAAGLAYALLGISFWLMIQGPVIRLVGLACFVVALPLLIVTGRAFTQERCRGGDRRFVREFMPAMVIYMVVMLYLWPLQKGMSPGWPKTTLVLLPMLPIIWAMLASIRHVLSSDELERRQHLEALAIGVSLVCVVAMGLGLLGAARVVVLDGATALLLVYPAICVTYGLTRCFMVWRARQE